MIVWIFTSCSTLSLAQINGDLISRSAVAFPAYEDATGIEMYYDKSTYDQAVSDKEVSIEKIVYHSDGLKVVAYLSTPVGTGKGSYPVIIFNRGSGARNDISYVHAPLFKKLVHAGFIVLAPALRGSEGGEGVDEVGGRELNDIMNIVPLLKHLHIADAGRLFMLGESRGGIMTYLAIKEKFPIKAAAVVGANTDMASYLKDRPWAEQFFKDSFPEYPTKKDSILQTRSALYWAEALNVPLLILNGQADPQVDPLHALQLASKLTVSGKTYQLLILEGGNHILSGVHTDRRDQEMIAWFKKHME